VNRLIFGQDHVRKGWVISPTLFFLSMLLLFSFLSLGCVGESDRISPGYSVRPLYNMSGPQLYTGPKTYTQTDICEISKACMAFACKNNTPTFLGVQVPWAESSLYGGECGIFVTLNTTDDSIDDVLDDYGYDYFPMGVGLQSLSDSVAVSRYTNSSVTSVVFYSYLTEDGRLIPEPDPRRLRYLLDRNIIPVYVWFSGNWTPNPGTPSIPNEMKEYLVNWSETLGENGPVIIIPFATTNHSLAMRMNGSIRSLAITIHQKCPTCLVGVYVDSSWNGTQIESYLNSTLYQERTVNLNWKTVPGHNLSEMDPDWAEHTSSVDLVGLGVYFNDFPCSGYYPVSYIMSVGRRILYTYHRPNVIVYFGGSLGPGNPVSSHTIGTGRVNQWTDGSPDGSGSPSSPAPPPCSWTERDIYIAYRELFNHIGIMNRYGTLFINLDRAFNTSYSLAPRVNEMYPVMENDSITGVGTTGDRLAGAGVVLPGLALVHIVNSSENLRPLSVFSWNGVDNGCEAAGSIGTFGLSDDDFASIYSMLAVRYAIYSGGSEPGLFDNNTLAYYTCGYLKTTRGLSVEVNELVTNDFVREGKNYYNVWERVSTRELSLADSYNIDPFLMHVILDYCSDGSGFSGLSGPGGSGLWCSGKPDYEIADAAARGTTIMNDYIMSHPPNYLYGPGSARITNRDLAVRNFATVYSAVYGPDQLTDLIQTYENVRSSDTECKRLTKFLFKEECQQRYFPGEYRAVDHILGGHLAYFEDMDWYDNFCTES